VLGCSALVLVLFGGIGWLSREEPDVTGAIDGDKTVASAKGEERVAICLLPSLDEDFLANIAATAAMVAAVKSLFSA
jgi:hypothetical protein